MNTQSPLLDWQNWMQRWDQQQRVYLPDREERFTIMMDVLEVLLPEQFVAIDLACGPGSISQRLLTRFPQARSIAVDFDPVLLTLGQHVLSDMQNRLRWVEADLRDPSWVTQLGEAQVDAVLSTTALHWLPSATLVQLYQQLAQLVRPGGVFMNGDHLAFAPSLSTFRKAIEEIQKRRLSEALHHPKVEDWTAWWNALKREAGMEALFAERERRFINRTHSETETLAELHEAALRDAGFREVGVIWQNMDNRIVLAVR